MEGNECQREKRVVVLQGRHKEDKYSSAQCVRGVQSSRRQKRGSKTEGR